MAYSRTTYKPNALRWFNKLLRWTYGAYLLRRFHVKGVGLDLFKKVKPPYVIIPTHQGILDPFMVTSLLHEPIYWVTSDGNMRSTLLKGLLSLVGSIPKSKAIPDLATVNWIVEVIRKRGGVVGIFAEGQASWDGHTQELVPSTGKLLRVLKVPVIVAVLKGAYYSQPRWSWNHRYSGIEIEFKLLMDGAEARALPSAEILARLSKAMEYDEVEWRAANPILHAAPRLAHHLELALFMCPSCGGIGSMRSHGRKFYCRSCGHVERLTSAYEFKPVGQSKAYFSNIREWSLWQDEAFEKVLASSVEKAGEDRPIFSDSGAILMIGRKMNPLRKAKTGAIILYRDRIELATLLGQRLKFYIKDIEGHGVLKQQILEFYRGRTLYQFRFPRRFQSARKWYMAINTLKAMAAAKTAEA